MRYGDLSHISSRRKCIVGVVSRYIIIHNVYTDTKTKMLPWPLPGMVYFDLDHWEVTKVFGSQLSHL